MTLIERQRYILQQLKRHEAVKVNELAEKLDVTPVTIRSDLDNLERRGLAVKVHGGAVKPEPDELPRYFDDTILENSDRKRAIANCAIDLVAQDSTIIVDAGSTTAIFSQLLHGLRLTVLTNSVPAVNELVSDAAIDLVVSGGAVRKPVRAMVGEFARWAYQSLHADTVFLGASGFSATHGVTTANLLEAEAKRAMLDSANTVCLLVDSTKLDKVKMAKICDWDRIDYLITDSVPNEFLESISGYNVTVIRAVDSADM